MQNTKIRAAAFTCCLLFPLTRVRTFPGGLAQTPSAISRCLRATRLSSTVIYFFTSFPFSVSSIFQFLCRQLTHTAGNTSRSVFACCQNSTLSLFFRSKYSHSFASRHAFFRRQPAASYPHHSYPSTSQNLAFRIAGHTLPVPFSFKAFSAFHQPSHFLPASAGHILPAAFLPILKPESRAPACRPLLQIYHTYLTYKSQTLTFGSAGQHHSITNHSHRRPPSSPDASGLPHFPSTLLQPSTPPISHFFFFFFLPPFFFFSFFSFFFPLFLFFLLFIIFSLHFLFSRLFLFAFLLFSFLFPFYFFYHITLHVFYVHQPKGCKTERSSVSRSRSHDVQWTSVLRRPKRREDSLPLAWFRGSAPYSFLFFFMYSFIYIFFLSGRQADSGRGSGGCAYVKVHIKIT